MSLRLCICLRGQWRRPDFLLLWAGQTVSQVDLLVTGFALSLTTIVLLHASSAQMALLSVTGISPMGSCSGWWLEYEWTAYGDARCCLRRMSGGQW